MDQLLQLLKDGKIEKFNLERPYELNFFAEDLSALDLRGVDFSGANLEKSDLTDSNFEDANLSKARLVGTDLTNTNMRAANLYRAKLDEIYAETSCFDEADMRQTSLHEAEFHGCSFVGTQLTEAKGRKVQIKNSNCSFVEMSSTKLNESIIHDCTFENALMDGIRLAKAEIISCQFPQASMHKSLLAESAITKSIFQGTNISQSNFNEATIQESSFQFCNLSRSDFTGIDLTALDIKTCEIIDIHTELGQKPITPISPPEHLFIEAPLLALQDTTLFCAWINPESNGSILRYLIFDLAKGTIKKLGTIPSSPNLIRGMRVKTTPEGFVLLCFEQRPSNIYAIFYCIDNKGDCSRFGQIPLTYSTDFASRYAFSMYEIRYHKDIIELYILGRNAPKLHVHQLRFNGEFNHFVHSLPTAEGLFGGDFVYAYTKGGTACALSVKGVGEIYQPPKGFPGRYFQIDTFGKNLIGTWLAASEQGIPPKKGVFASGFEDNANAMRFHNREVVQSCDITHDDKDVWIAYTISNHFDPPEIWIAQATGTAQYNIPATVLEDEVDILSLIRNESNAYVVLTLINGTLQILQLSLEQAIPLGTVRI